MHQRAHDTEINCVTFFGSAAVVTGSSDGTCGVWDTTSGKQTATLRAESHPVMCVDVVDNYVLGGSNDKVARLWDAESERLRVSVAIYHSIVHTAAMQNLFSHSPLTDVLLVSFKYSGFLVFKF